MLRGTIIREARLLATFETTPEKGAPFDAR